jgi:ABC-2 type transport system ATP-binding protein
MLALNDFDGALSDLVRSLRPGKRAVFEFSRPVNRSDVERYGTVIEHSELKTVLEILPDALSQALAGALAELPVADVNIEDPPLEDVLRDLFQKGRSEGAK